MEIKIEDNGEIIINDKMCYRCGNQFRKGATNGDEEKSMHHTLPRHLKPKKNVVVPLCQDCHDEININDTRGLIKFTHRLYHQIKEWFYLVRGNMHLVQSQMNQKKNGKHK